MGKINKKQGFPFGIFLVLMFLLLLLSLAVSTGYFYWTVSTRITEIEENVKKYSSALVEAFANVAGINFPLNNYTELRKLFSVRLTDAGNEEAFFILADGSIVAHSNPEAEKKVEGNVANDEFRYNLEQLLQPVNLSAREALFYDYNIQDQKIPFDRRIRLYIKEYLYPEINSPGWLATRAVFVWDKPVGSVNLIISKQPIYGLIFSQLEESIYIAVALAAVSFIISLLVAFIVFFRYRGARGTADFQQPVFAELVSGSRGAGTASAGNPFSRSPETMAIPVELPLTHERVVTYARPGAFTRESAGARRVKPEGRTTADRTVIRDAIPVKKR